MATIRERLKQRANWNFAIPAVVFFALVQGYPYAAAGRIPHVGPLEWWAPVIIATMAVRRLLVRRVRCPECRTRLGAEGYKLSSCPHCSASFGPIPERTTTGRGRKAVLLVFIGLIGLIIVSRIADPMERLTPLRAVLFWLTSIASVGCLIAGVVVAIPWKGRSSV